MGRRSSASSAARCGPRSIRARSARGRSPIDCDVIQADGGTRTAAITGGYVALALAVRRLQKAGKIDARIPSASRWRRSRPGSSTARRASISPTSRTREAEVDCNFVMTGDGRFVEIQATAEKGAFSRRAVRLAGGAGGRGDEDAVRPPARGDRTRAAVKVVVATRNKGKLREIVPLLAQASTLELRHDRRAGARRRAARGRRDVRGERARQGAPGGARHRPARHRRRLGAGGRRARRARPASTRPATPVRAPTTTSNNAKLLEALRGVPPARRTARFRCVAVFVDPARGLELVRDGACEGEILEAPRGDGRLRLRPAVPRSGASAARWPSCRSTRRTASRTGPRRSARSRTRSAPRSRATAD